MNIQIKPTHIRQVASKCGSISEEIRFSRDDLENKFTGHSQGLVKNKMVNIINKTDVCVQQTKLLIFSSNNFMTGMANHFENIDQNISKEIGDK